MNKKVFNGKGKGSLLLLSGLHGNEYTGMAVLHEFLRSNDFEQTIKKFETITVVQYFNDYGIKNNCREFEANNDYNRIFGQDTSKIELLKELVDSHDYIVDIHTSPNCSTFVLLNNNNTANSYVQYCKDYNIPYALAESNSTNTVKQYALDKGKIAFTLECNKLGIVDIDSMYNTLAVLEIILYAIKKLTVIESETKFKPIEVVKSPRSGIVYQTSYKTCKIVDIETDEEFLFEFNPNLHHIVTFHSTGYINAGEDLSFLQPRN